MRKFSVVALVLLLVLFVGAVSKAETGIVTASALVLREGPNLSYGMLGEVPTGARLTLLSFEDGWYQVSYDGRTGYVFARYVRVELPAGVPELSPEPPFEPTYTPPSGATPNLSLPEVSFTGDNNPSFPRVLKLGDTGNSVIDLQVTLLSMGYETPTDGQFGYDTLASVMKLQRALSIDPDGIVGAQTRRLIGNQSVGSVEKLDWWLGGNVAFARLTEGFVVDVRSGIRFRISRYGGDNHLDAEPLTQEDTQRFLSMLGGAWTWDRRPVFVEVNGRVIAASMNCMPNEGQHILDNDFDGHFCIHFLSSRTHETDRIDELHAACVEEAWNNRRYYSP